MTQTQLTNAGTTAQLDRVAAQLREGNLDAAERGCREILDQDATHARASELLGLVACGRGDHASGLEFLRRSLALAPGRPEPYNNLASQLQGGGEPGAVIGILEQAVALAPELADSHHNLGVAWLRQNAPATAAASFERATELAPQRAATWLLLGNARYRRAQYAGAVDALLRALALNPASVQAAYHLANALRDIGQLDATIAHLERCLAIRPDFGAAEFSLALSYLMAGRFAPGWRAYESRWRGSGDAVRGRMKRHETRAQPWLGGPVASDARLLVTKEQGWGDNIMFACYVPRLVGRFREVGYYCPVTLERLVRHSLGDRCIVSADRRLLHDPRFTHATPLLSLPLAMALDDPPGEAPYLTALPEDIERWRQKLADAPGMRIGLAWTGGRILPQRSMPLSAMAPLLRATQATWLSLSKVSHLADEHDRARQAGLLDWVEECRDFADTAALIECLDLVISIDTAVAHLAGALGKPVWLVNRFESDWRWLRGRTDSPWYPTMRIFTQPRPGDWDGAVAAMLPELIARIGR